jgi:hypothetical protein
MPRTFNIGTRVLISAASASGPRRTPADRGVATVDLAVNAQDRNVPSGEPTAARGSAGGDVETNRPRQRRQALEAVHAAAEAENVF